MNNDISGLGVRISFYLQTLFLAFLCARSTSLDEIIGALYTLIATNMAIAVTSLLLGLKPDPEISLPDALIVFYLLFLAWVAIVFSLPACNRLEGGTKIVKAVSVVQSYTVFAFAFALLTTAKTFGRYPYCNANAMVVLFGSFKVFNAGMIIGWIVTVITFVVYTSVTIIDYLPEAGLRRIKKVLIVRRRPPILDDSTVAESPYPSQGAPSRPGKVDATGAHSHGGPTQDRYYPSFSGKLVIELFAIVVVWALAVMNTELLIKANHSEPSNDGQSTWQFGQVLPLFLLVLPLANTLNAFSEHGLRHSKNAARRSTHRVSR